MLNKLKTALKDGPLSSPSSGTTGTAYLESLSRDQLITFTQKKCRQIDAMEEQHSMDLQERDEIVSAISAILPSGGFTNAEDLRAQLQERTQFQSAVEQALKEEVKKLSLARDHMISRETELQSRSEELQGVIRRQQSVESALQDALTPNFSTASEMLKMQDELEAVKASTKASLAKAKSIIQQQDARIEEQNRQLQDLQNELSHRPVPSAESASPVEPASEAKEVEELRAQCARLQELVVAAQEAARLSSKECEEIRAKCDEATLRRDEESRRAETLAGELDSVKETLHQQIDVLASELQSVQVALTAVRADLEKANQAYVNSTVENAHSQAVLEERERHWQEEHSAWSTKEATLTTAYANLDAAREEAVNTNTTLRAKLADESARHEREYGAVVAARDAAELARDSVENKLGDTIQQVEKLLAARDAAVDGLAAERAMRDTQTTAAAEMQRTLALERDTLAGDMAEAAQRLASATMERDQARVTLLGSQREADELRARCAELDTKVVALAAEAEELRERHADAARVHEETIGAHVRELSQVTAQRDDLAKLNEKTASRLEGLVVEREKLQKQVDSIAERSGVEQLMITERDQARSERDSARTTLETCQQQLEDACRERDAEREHTRSQGVQLQDLMNGLALKEDALAAATSQVDAVRGDMQAVIARASGEVSTLRTEIADRQRQCDSLSQELVATQEAYQRTLRHVAEMDNKLEQAQQELTNNVQRMSDETKSFEALKHDRDTVASRIDDLEKRLADALVERALLLQERDAAVVRTDEALQTISRLEGERDDALQRAQEATRDNAHQIENLAQERLANTAEVERVQAKLVVIEKDRAAIMDRYEQSAQEVAAARRDLESQGEQLRVVEKERTDAANECIHLKEVLDNVSKERDAAVKSSQDELDALRRETASLHAANETCLAQLRSMMNQQTDAAQSTELAQQEAVKSSERLTQALAELSVAQQRGEMLSAESAEKAAKLIEASRHREEALRERDEAIDQVRQERETQEQLRTRILELESSTRGLEAQWAQAGILLTETQARVASLTSELDAALDQATIARGTNDDLRGRFDAERTTVRETEAQLTATRSELEALMKERDSLRAARDVQEHALETIQQEREKLTAHVEGARVSLREQQKLLGDELEAVQNEYASTRQKLDDATAQLAVDADKMLRKDAELQALRVETDETQARDRSEIAHLQSAAALQSSTLERVEAALAVANAAQVDLGLELEKERAETRRLAAELKDAQTAHNAAEMEAAAQTSRMNDEWTRERQTLVGQVEDSESKLTECERQLREVMAARTRALDDLTSQSDEWQSEREQLRLLHDGVQGELAAANKALETALGENSSLRTLQQTLRTTEELDAAVRECTARFSSEAEFTTEAMRRLTAENTVLVRKCDTLKRELNAKMANPIDWLNEHDMTAHEEVKQLKQQIVDLTATIEEYRHAQGTDVTLASVSPARATPIPSEIRPTVTPPEAGVKEQYRRNVLLKFMSEPSSQDGLLPVLATLFEYSAEEMDAAKQKRKSRKGIFG